MLYRRSPPTPPQRLLQAVAVSGTATMILGFSACFPGQVLVAPGDAGDEQGAASGAFGGITGNGGVSGSTTGFYLGSNSGGSGASSGPGGGISGNGGVSGSTTGSLYTGSTGGSGTTSGGPMVLDAACDEASVSDAPSDGAADVAADVADESEDAEMDGGSE